MRHLSSLLFDALRRAGVERGVAASQTISAFRIAAGRLADASGARPRCVEGKTLVVDCPNASLAQEIRMREGEILSRVNTICKKAVIDRIRCVIQ